MDVQDFIVNRDQHMRPLEYDLSENFNELVRYMQDMGVLDNVPVGTTSESEIVSISDAYPAPPRALNVYGKSTQNGTPTPDAPVPILSVVEPVLTIAGKNLLPDVLPDNTIRATMSSVISGAANARVFAVPCALNTDYFFSSNTNGTISHIGFGDRLPEVGDSVYSVATMANRKTWSANSGEHPYILVNVTSVASFDLIPSREGQIEVGSSATAYQPYVTSTTVPNLLPEGTDLRSLPDGTKDALNLSYLRPSTRAGWAWYSRTLTALIGETTTAATDGITGAVGVDVMSTTGEIADGPTVLYKLASAQTTTIDPIELPELPAPNATVWCDGGSATPTLVLEYVRDTNAAIAELSEAIADIVSG